LKARAGGEPAWRDRWVQLTALLMVAALLAWALPTAVLDWQPERALHEPWRAVTAGFVHWSPTHLLTNLGAALAVGAFGRQARVPASWALAYAATWPLTHGGLGLLKPELAHYGGLSGGLHGGVALVCLWLLVAQRGARRWVGAGVALGLVIKAPLGPARVTSPEWDIALAPASHLSGALAGLACGLAALAWGGGPAQSRTPSAAP
jgi:rhomboid family GlyGly-CTERM serine protease